MPFFALFLCLLCLAGLVYQLAAAFLLDRFMRTKPGAPPQARPPISILKPLCGDEPGLLANLESLCHQDYPGLQLICGVADPEDPAGAVVRALQSRWPQADITLVIDPRRHGCNLKVGNLLNMIEQVKHPVVAIADSDVFAYPGYLDDLAAGLADPQTGLVTSLYIGRPQRGLWSRLGALAINHGFLPSALVARALGRRDGCFGATMALRHDVLTRIGGLSPLANVLADDWALGAAVRRAGLAIAVAARPVDLSVEEADLSSLLAHEIRWGRTIAAVDRPAYMASVITQPVALSGLALLLGGLTYIWLPLLAVAVRLAVVRAEERVLRLEKCPFWLLLLREVLNFFVFVAACGGRSVWWRGNRFRVRRDGTLEVLEGKSA
ncbi:MAG TPA: glycosyltransferase [Rhodospirillaceae bacterium]|nr:glycosyltransferase [Rhodospirillaceae bacterium]